MWHFLQTRFLEEIRAQRWYNGIPPYGLRGFLDDKANRILGYPILRQIRNGRFHCKVVEPLNAVIYECSGPQGIDKEDQRDFCAGWTSSNNSDDSACNFPEFRYEDGTQLQTNPYLGNLGTYGAGGYVIRFQGTRAEIIGRLQKLQEKHWIDERTRAIFIEFSTYNANVNIFGNCKIIFEYFQGGIELSWMFEPVKLLKVGSNLSDSITLLCEFVFVLATIFFTGQELWEIKKLKCNYFSHNWNIAELLILISSYTEIFLYIYRSYLASSAVSDFYRTKGNDYVRIDDATLVDQYYHYILSFILFISILKLIKLLQFNKQMSMLSRTIHLCWEELSFFFILFGLTYLSFCWLFYFIYFRDLREFAHLMTSILTTFKMMLGKFNVAEMTAINRFLPVLFFFFSVTNSMILINIMLSIILQAFATVREELGDDQINIIDYMWTSLKKRAVMQPNSVYQVKPDFSHKRPHRAFDEDVQDEDEEEKLPDKVVH